MKKSTCKFFILCVLVGLLNCQFISSQCMMIEIPLEQQVQKSEIIVEGKVIAKEPFWDADHKRIYTKNTIEVYKVFKGDVISNIDVITIGGVIGYEAQEFVPSLQLQLNEVGLFLLEGSSIRMENENGNLLKYRPYGGPQGFFEYDISSNRVNNVFKTYSDIQTEFYNVIKSKTKTNFTEILEKKFAAQKGTNSINKSSLAISISGFGPNPINAGTKEILTINGSGFGSPGKVSFSDNNVADIYTFYDALPTQIVSWTDNIIEVEVPARAGTGFVKVTNNGAEELTAGSLLTIPYSQLNSISSGVSYPRQHIDDNGTGGYTFEMHTDFDTNMPAREAFLRALDTWRCETEVNWIVGDMPTPAPAEFFKNGINIIAFDTPTTELGVNVLGGALSYSQGCPTNGGANIEWYIEELDIVFDDDDINWQFGPNNPAPGELDFESVILHELGHAHQLGHVNDTNDLMNWAISPGSSLRTLNASNIACATDVFNRSTSLDIECDSPNPDVDVMTAYSCPVAGLTDAELNKNIILFPNPSSGWFYIQKTASINLKKVDIYDVGGRLVATHDLSDTSNLKTIKLHSVSSGLYFAKVKSDQGFVTKRIVLK